MQIVSIWDNLHEMTNLYWGKSKKKYFNIKSAENFTQHAKHQRYVLVQK